MEPEDLKALKEILAALGNWSVNLIPDRMYGGSLPCVPADYLLQAIASHEYMLAMGIQLTGGKIDE